MKCYGKSGVATIEAAGIIGILLMIVMFAYAVGVHAYRASSTADVVERVINENQVKPFRLGQEYALGADTLVVNAAAIDSFIDNSSTQLVNSLVSDVGGGNLNNTDVGVEVGYMTLNIDEATGAITGINGYQIRHAGGLSIASSEGALAALQAIANSQSAPSDFAVLTSAAVSGARFLRYAVIAAVAVRVREGTFEGNLLRKIGVAEEIYQRKVVSLRGDVA